MRIALLAFCFLPLFARAQADLPVEVEIQIFQNYRGPNNYDKKKVSTYDHLYSAYLLWDDPAYPAMNGACYFGEPEEALTLFQKMVEKFNIESGGGLRMQGYVFDDPETFKKAVHIDGVYENGQLFAWFERMRKCDHASTEPGFGETHDSRFAPQ